jgi:D-alanine-D-alanine ligase
MSITATTALDELRIGVLCGGRSPERPGSLASGEAAVKGCADAGLTVELIDITDTPPQALAGRIDLALLATHGLYGEDGKLQGALDWLNIPYTGSGVLASAIGMDKRRFKAMMFHAHIDTPSYIEVLPKWNREMATASVQHSLGWPVFVKPASGGGSLGAGPAWDNHDFDRLYDQVISPAHEYGTFIAEELIHGNPVTVGVLEVDGAPMTLPPLECETDRPFYDYEAKHDIALRREYCPARLTESQLSRITATALQVHRLIGAHGVSRIDFMVAPNGRQAVLEVNTVPGLSAHGNLATMAGAAGISYPELMRHLARTALTKPVYVP